MSNPRHSVVFVWIVFLSAACDVFLPNMGGEGEECSDMGNCESGLACHEGTCIEPPGFGEECDPTYQDKYPVCGDNLFCIDGICSEAGGEGQPCIHNTPWANQPCDEGLECFYEVCTAPMEEEVKQPNAELYWLRCPVGFDWDGYRCSTDDLPYKEQLTWDDAMDDCPGGYRLPTLEEYQSLMGDCEPQYDTGEYTNGNCDNCGASSACDQVFTQKSSSWAFDSSQVRCWSSTQHWGYSAPEPGMRVYMNLRSGYYGGLTEDNSAAFAICVREP